MSCFRNLYAFLAVCHFAMISLTDSFRTKSTATATVIVIVPERPSEAAPSGTEGIQESLEEIFETWEEISKQKGELEECLAKAGRVIKLNQRTTDLNSIRAFKTDPLMRMMELAHMPFEEASNQLYKKFNLSAKAINNDLRSMELNGKFGSELREACKNVKFTAKCDPNSKYRRADGQCNNLQNPIWGSSAACKPRLLPPNYVGVSGFRVSVNGEPLPSPRTISLNLHYHYNKPNNYVNQIYAIFGQYLDHDMTMTPASTTVGNQAINCCPPEDETHPQCEPILIPEDDPFYSQFNVTCMNFVRSALCPTCTLGPRQFMNQVTSAIDSSVIYGSYENETISLRTNDGTGRLKAQSSPDGEVMSSSPDPENDQCSFPETNEICFKSGDFRVNQNTILASFHTIFHREHNRIASLLGPINPHWSDEKLFQEARRIVGAQMQAITYKEYLPITLGSDKMTDFKLWPGCWTNYDPNEDPTILLEFATAAFRFGHTMVNSIMARRPLNATNQPRYLRDEFFQPFDLYKGFTGPLLEGASSSPAQSWDRHVVSDLNDYLYRVRGNQTGLDLTAITIQRGRDHGLPTYVETVSYCFDDEIKIRNFSDLLQLMDPEQAFALENNYKFVEDIDLWPGIVSEKYIEGAVVGPTGACIIGRQFHKLKYGDRFYFEHADQAGSFTYEQLEEIRKITLSQIICLNTEVEKMPINAMIFKSEDNPYIECRDVKGIDLSHWEE